VRKTPKPAAGDGRPWEVCSADGKNTSSITSPIAPVEEIVVGSGLPPAGRIAVIDIEGRSLLDIKNVGAAKWIEHASTEPHCVGYAIDNQPAKVWCIRIPLVPLAARFEPIPEDLLAVLLDPEYLIVAHNAIFDRLFAKHKLAEYGWPEVPLSRWRCSLAAATSKGLRARLVHLAKDLGLPVQKGDAAIVSQMAKPRPPRKDEDPSKVNWNDDPERFERLCNHCMRDADVTRELIRRVPLLSGATQKEWELDQIINDRGFYTDGSLIETAITIVAADQQAIQIEVQRITGGRITSINQVDKILSWMATAGYILNNLQQETLQQALTRTDLTPEVRRVIELRLQAVHPSKYKTLRQWRSVDGRVRGAFNFYTAQTGRWSAGGPQPHNFPREVDDIAAKAAAVMSGDIEEVRKLGPPSEVASEIVRAVVRAAPGNKLLVLDYSAIESRTLAWIANETSKLAMWEKFDQTQDPRDEPYFILGKQFQHPDTIARKFGKTGDLAFGYGGGIPAYRSFAPVSDNSTDAQIKFYQQTWHAQHPNTTAFWHGIEHAALQAVRLSPAPIKYGRFTLRCELLNNAPFLFITLPSGRDVSYPYVEIILNDRGNPALTFMDDAFGQWAQYKPGKGAWGGVFTGHLTQATARDLLAAAMLRLEAAGYPVVLHVHDAIRCEVPDGQKNI
jgi:DNA polymerase